MIGRKYARLRLLVGREILVGKCFETAIAAGKFFR